MFAKIHNVLPASCPVVTESLIEDVSILQHVTVHCHRRPNSSLDEKPQGADGHFRVTLQRILVSGDSQLTVPFRE